MSPCIVRHALRLVAFAAIFFATRIAAAHKPSDSYLTLDVDGRAIDARWDIAVRDLDYAIGLDGDGDGAVTWGELRARFAEIDSYALARLTVRADGDVCAQALRGHEVVEHSDGAYVVIRFKLACRTAPRAFELAYSLFFELDPAHRGLLHVGGAGEPRALTFATDRRVQHVPMGGPQRAGRVAEIGAIIGVGVHHIWEGYDHLLFLLALLLPSVLRREENAWMPVSRFRPALFDVLRIVTAFTVAHSITLSLAALDLVRLPTRITESAIAASVVVAAANNVVPVMRDDRWLAAFALGLLHGFGFSATLVDLGLPRGSLLPALFGFNLGVEIGQLAVVAAFLPLAYLVRRSIAYRRLALVFGSIAIGSLATVWMVERVFDLKILT